MRTFFAHMVVLFALVMSSGWLHGQSVTRLVLVNADSNADLFDLIDGMTLDRAMLPSQSLNVRAETDPATVGSVRFDLDGVLGFGLENVAPYALAGDSGGNYNAWTPSLGSHTLVATAFSGAGASGMAGAGLSVQFDVIDSSQAPPGQAPTVRAGADVFPALPLSTATLDGQVVAGDAPLASVQWTQLSGGAVTIVDPASATTLIQGLAAEAVYFFRLEAVDTQGRSAFDDVIVSSVPAGVSSGTISGDAKLWHRITVTFDGPVLDEAGSPQPFRDHRLDVSFTNGSTSWLVPGFFAADGDAAETGATSGGKWRVHFQPTMPGAWSYTALLRTGSDVAIEAVSGGGTPVAGVNGASGSFVVGATDASLPDLRARGLLRHEGEHYLRFAGDGSAYLKGGADSPENLLAYGDFDGTFDVDGSFLHAYLPHVGDWQAGDPEWAGGLGHGLVGAVNYLSSKGMNSIYFLTMNVGGDGNDVWPWVSPTERQRFDVSKLAQWEIVFSHMTQRGIMLHVITQETENDQLLDGGALGLERKLYYRELVARFAHHPAVVWNLGEENTNSTGERLSFAAWIRDLDPYDHPITVHTFPGAQNSVWTPLLGEPNFEASSIQTNLGSVHALSLEWRQKTSDAGQPWAIFLDEIGPATQGVAPDSVDPDHDDVRMLGLWGNLMAGGAGCEWYFGYGFPNDDLDCEDWRSRDIVWDLTRYALLFFQDHLPFPEMEPADALVSAADAYCFAKPGEVYAVYLPSGGLTDIDLPDGSYQVDWYDPRNGGALIGGGTVSATGGVATLGPPPSNATADWALRVERIADPGPRILVFYETAGFNHGSQITAGRSLFANLASSEGLVVVEAPESGPHFTPASLATFDAVVFLNTTGDVLNGAEQAAFEDFIAAGGAYVGIHSATDTEYGWPFYGQLVGAWFSNHPPGTTAADLDVVEPNHPSTVGLSPSFTWTDEWYNFQTNPADDPTTLVLVTIDESTYSGGTMGDPHPISWAREFGGGRSWYTAFGHNVATYSEPFFRDHVLGGLLWAIGDEEEGFIRGDVNGDGSLDISDALSELANLFSQPSSAACSDARDANDDGQNNITDPIVILGFLFNQEPAPPLPFPTCGPDPTADSIDCAGVSCP